MGEYDSLIRLDEVKGRTGLSRTSIYRNIEAGTFPEPYKLGAQAVAWKSSEITAWIEARPRASDTYRRSPYQGARA